MASSTARKQTARSASFGRTSSGGGRSSSGGKGRSTSSASRKTSSNRSGKRSSASSKVTAIRPEKERTDARVGREIRICVVAVISILLLLGNLGLIGSVGNMVSDVLFGLFGLMAYVFPFVLFFGYAFFEANRKNALIARKMFGLVLLFLFLCAFLQLLTLGFNKDLPIGELYRIPSEDHTGGGFLGGIIVYAFGSLLGVVGAYVLTVAGLVIASIILTQRPLITEFGSKSTRAARAASERRKVLSAERSERRLMKREARAKRKAEEEDYDDGEDYVDLDEDYVDLDEDYGSDPLTKVTLKKRAKKSAKTEEEQPVKVMQSAMPSFLADTSSEKNKSRAGSSKKQTVPASALTESIRKLNSQPAFTADEGETIFAMPSFLRANERKQPHKEPSSAHEAVLAPDPYDIEIENEPLTNKTEDLSYEGVPFGEEVRESTPGGAALMEREAEASASLNETRTGRGRDSSAKEKPSTKKEKQEGIANISSEIEKSAPKKPEYELPPTRLLTKGKPAKGDSRQHLMDTAAKLQQTLENFGVNVKVVNVSRGPTVTRYELQPDMGVKVSRIVNLQDDIKLNLATSEIRIEAPIPGKAAVGIEVPNKEIAPVMLHDIIDCEEFRNSKAKLPFAVGKDIGGRPVIADIEKMPHLLIAGATGSGKSVCINTLIVSILYGCTPDQVRFLMIDPKVVELKIYDGIPHLLIPVVTDAKKAAGALNWAVQEMTDRYNKFAQYPGVRDLKSYNARVKKMNRELDENEVIPEMPRIIVIVDELADLMMVASSEVEDAICRLAQLARAAGIHLIIATQRPSVNVVTGLIKANMPSRIALAVTSGTDSRTILDMNGAEKLLGKGDMLFYPQGYPKPARVQGSYVSDDDITKIVDYFASQADEVEYNREVEEQISSTVSAAGQSSSQESDDGRDEYFADSGRLIIEKDKASIGMLQRAFKIGFNRAARIMDQLADAGVVGGEEGTKPRKILMTMEEFEQLLNNME